MVGFDVGLGEIGLNVGFLEGALVAAVIGAFVGFREGADVGSDVIGDIKQSSVVLAQLHSFMKQLRL